MSPEPQAGLSQEEAMDIEEKIESSDSDFEYDLKAPELFNQTDLNDLIRDLGLSKSASEILASKLKEFLTTVQGNTISSNILLKKITSYFGNKVVIQSIPVFFACGIVEPKVNIGLNVIGLLMWR
ncbi:hypothetical protein EVAR_9117_1 [Eumeta japonica]|uniref:Uncharacterized protein n=1 Tax=Eumeta variegata TaxID=151549 RepID=A0A4C1TWL6_EUMVA|nr:hypothetical protein EVAR_9117_1 [Eumeta japonica]